jgi:DNA-directed RNA polymerase specialized sigma24 family protein
MDRQAALQELATAHAVAVRLHDAGAADESIAEALGIPVTSVACAVRIAEAKLDALLGQQT